MPVKFTIKVADQNVFILTLDNVEYLGEGEYYYKKGTGGTVGN